MKRKWVLVFIAIVLIVSAAGVYWLRSRPTRIERFYEPTPDQAKITRDAQAQYKSLEMTPLDAFADLDTSQVYFDRVPIQDPQPGTVQIPAILTETELAVAKHKLRTVMAQFMHYRFTTTGDPERDVDRYIAWRHHRGDIVLPIDDHPPYNGDVYEYYMGTQLPPNINLDHAYRQVHLAADEQNPDTSRVVAISTDPAESIFVTWWQHTHIGSDHPIINHPRGKEYWLGGQSGSFSTWFKCALQDPRENTRVQVQLIAMAGIVVEAADGSRYPLKLWLAWNTQTKDWMISGMNIANAEMSKIQGFVY